MTLLTPLGLLGLIGLIGWLIIYLIKPNFQQKFISSTYVWKLSLKYRKKKLPVNKLRNLFLIICQLLILTACAIILAKPVEVLKNHVEVREVIAIIDSSASMRASIDGETRFERAIDGVLELSEKVWKEEGYVSVIYADSKATFLAERASVEYSDKLSQELSVMLEGDDIACSYGSADIDAAMTLCEEVLFENPNAEIHLYTDKEYDYLPEGITLQNVAEQSEWNAAILNAYTELSDGYYAFYVEVACYGINKDVEVTVEVQNANADSSTDKGARKIFKSVVPCDGDKTKTLVFMNADLIEQSASLEDVMYEEISIDKSKDDRIYSYQTVFVSISEDDAFAIDNTFQIYGGQKETIKIQYASSNPNPFYGVVLNNLANAYKDLWDIQVTEVKKDDHESVKNSGFDMYFYEEAEVPEKLPTDGIVVLLDPQEGYLPSGVGFTISKVMESKRGETLVEGDPHPILSNMTVENIELTRYTEIVYSAGFETLMYCNSKPVVTVRDDGNTKMVVVGFSIHYSTFAITKEFPLFIYNLFGYFMPTTISDGRTDFEVNETITLNARGPQLAVKCESMMGSETTTYTEFPSTFTVATPGTYSFSQTTYSGSPVKELVYVHIPSKESNICEKADTVKAPERTQDDTEYYKDVIFYVAAAMVALLFIEWWLQSRETM